MTAAFGILALLCAATAFAAPPPPIPTQGLVAWLDASTIDPSDPTQVRNGSLVRWLPAIKGVAGAVQLVDELQPALASTSIGRTPLVLFNRTNTSMALPLSDVQFNSDGLTVFFVGKFYSYQGYSTVLDMSTGNRDDELAFLQFRDYLQYTTYIDGYYGGLASGGPYMEGEFDTYAWVHRPTGSAEIWYNGKMLKSGSVQLPRNVARKFSYIHRSFDEPTNGMEDSVAYAEMLVYNTALTSTQMGNVFTTLRTKWNLIVPTLDLAVWLDGRAINTSDPIQVRNASSGQMFVRNWLPSRVPSGAVLPAASQENEALQPVVANGVVYFLRKPGIPSFLAFEPLFTTWSPGFSIFAVVNFGTGGYFTRVFDFSNGNSTDDIALTQVGTTTTLGFQVFRDGSSSHITASNAILYGNQDIYEVTQNGQGVTIYKNGVSVNSPSIGQVPSFVKRTQCFLHKSYDPSEADQGPLDIAEFMIYDNVLSKNTRTRVYNYLSDKWGK